MIRRTRHILALALNEQGFALAEARAGRAGFELMRQTTLAVEQPLEDPEQSGAALAAHLNEHGYMAREVVVGLSASRLLARHRTVPKPANEAQLQDMLRLAVEREFTGGGRDLRIDYLAQRAEHTATHVLMVATAEDVLERLSRLSNAANLRLRAVTSTLLAVAAHVDAPGNASLLLLDDDGAELLVRTQGAVTAITHVNGPSAEALAEAIMRGLAGSAGEVQRLHVLDADADPAARDTSGIVAALGEWMEVTGPGAVAPAEAVAKAALADDALPIDLAHHKLGVDGRAGRLRRRRVVALATVTVLLLAVLAASFWQSASARVATLEAEYALIRDEAERLQQVRDRMQGAEPWFAARPAHLGCLWDLTRLFPGDRRIWVNHLRLRAGDSGSIQCQAESRRVMLELLEAMEGSPAFEQVQLRDWQEVDARGDGVRFEITFRHLPEASTDDPRDE